MIPRVDISTARTPADLADIEALERRVFARPWGREALTWELEQSGIAKLHIARAGGVLVAYCLAWLIVDELHVNSLAVDPARRRQGIGSRLLRAVIAEATAQGARSATLEVRRSNSAALALYDAQGFVVEGVRPDYYQEPREDALILWRRDLAVAPA